MVRADLDMWFLFAQYTPNKWHNFAAKHIAKHQKIRAWLLEVKHENEFDASAKCKATLCYFKCTHTHTMPLSCRLWEIAWRVKQQTVRRVSSNETDIITGKYNKYINHIAQHSPIGFIHVHLNDFVVRRGLFFGSIAPCDRVSNKRQLNNQIKSANEQTNQTKNKYPVI